MNASYPQYENAIIVGDTAAEVLAALRIYGRALVGGEIPEIERWHPTEKLLECTSTAFDDLPRILIESTRQMQAQYILLEDNGTSTENPAVMRQALEKAGLSVRVLNVQGDTLDVLTHAAQMYGKKSEAKEFAADYQARLSAAKKFPALPELKVLVLLGIRHRTLGTVYGLVATQRAELTQDVLIPLGCINPVKVPQQLEAVPGTYLLTPERLGELILSCGPDAIALCGDVTAAWQFIPRALAAKPGIAGSKVFRKQALIPLPWYCRAMRWRLPSVLEKWQGALSALSLL